MYSVKKQPSCITEIHDHIHILICSLVKENYQQPLQQWGEKLKQIHLLNMLNKWNPFVCEHLASQREKMF